LTNRPQIDTIGTSGVGRARPRDERRADMSRHTKPGRNDLCACGSGRKRKHCCDVRRDSPWRSRVLLALVGAAIIGGVAAGVLSYGESTSMTPVAGKVWSPEHGHYH
jgi:dTDP-4-dehydrorhamnose 3,5-epimerase-like enzyme